MDARVTRRSLLRSGAGLAVGMTLPTWAPWLARAGGSPLRLADSLPDPTRAAGTPDPAMPFDHVVVVMMENHSFDNYLGMLERRGHRGGVDGFKFDAKGAPANRQPYKDGYVVPVHAKSMCQPPDVDQTWNGTHFQIDGGKMDGFAKNKPGSMIYWDESDIPFYYSLAKTFTVGNRWFCSAPCQTFPNRRFLLAATAEGLISTDTNSIFDPLPKNGTIFDRLNAHGISWANYFTDLPGTGVWEKIPQSNLDKIKPVGQFYADCASGSLPAVSFVDPEFGASNDVGGALIGAAPQLYTPGQMVETQGGDEENPQNITLGEQFVAKVANAVIASPAWPRTLLVWTYDEHGGYFDHVPPPAAVTPDDIKPKIGPKDFQGGYDMYGPRVPAVVISPYSKPGGTTDVVHDHTSILATIEHKWNLPACTRRDANATTLMDFLDTTKARLLEPPALAAPGDLGASEQNCSDAQPTLVVQHDAGGTKGVKHRHHRRRKHHHKRKRHHHRRKHHRAKR
jgi:phospholipase C